MKHYFFEKIDSTNAFAKKVILQGEAAGEEAFLVTAQSQTAGRGRLSRSFSSEKGGLYMSYSVPYRTEDGNLTCLPLIAALGVRDVLKELAADQGGASNIVIKWPNDIQINGKKVCGILTEALQKDGTLWLVFGIGINISNSLPEELTQATTIQKELGVNPEPQKLAQDISSALERVFMKARYDCAGLIRKVEECCISIGRTVRCETTGVRGKALAIDRNGGLIVQVSDESREVITFGDVTVIE